MLPNTPALIETSMIKQPTLSFVAHLCGVLLLTCLAATTFAATKKTAVKSVAPPCTIGDFRRLTLTVHNPTERGTQAIEWIKERADSCNADKLKYILSNLGAWLGTAETPEISSVLYGLLEIKSSTDPKALENTYGAKKPPSPVPDTVQTIETKRPEPIVNSPNPAAAKTLPAPVAAANGTTTTGATTAGAAATGLATTNPQVNVNVNR